MPDTSPNIAAQHADYAASLPSWQKIDDCISGSEAMKAHDLATTTDDDTSYILRPNPDDKSADNQARYEDYVRRAVWYPATSRTLRGMVGQAFLKPPVLTVPRELAVLLANVDGSGTTLIQQARGALSSTAAKGRYGLLTDYPIMKETASRADVAAGIARPTICAYDPESIINWRTLSVGAEKILQMVMLAEATSVSDDDYVEKTETRYRELRLVDGIYTVLLWGPPASGSSAFQLLDKYQPKDGFGRLWDRIPFQCIGSESNDPYVDPAPLLDLVEMNIAHFRNSADYEESAYMCGQPTPWAAGLTEDWLKSQLGGKIRLGSRGGIPLPAGASVGLLQAIPNGLAKEAMDAKERQMVALGAKLIQPTQVQRTATESRLEYASEVSTLGACANNVADAYLRALGWAARFAGSTETSTFAIDADAEMRRMRPDELNQLTLTWQSKGLADSEYRGELRRGGVATLTDEEWKDEIDSSPNIGTVSLPVPPVNQTTEETTEGNDGGAV